MTPANLTLAIILGDTSTRSERYTQYSRGKKMPKISYCFYKYAILDEAEEPIYTHEHADIMHGFAGNRVAHRKPEPSPNEYDTFIMRFRNQVLAGLDCAIFDVARGVDVRVEHRYNPNTDDLELVDVPANDTIWTRFIMVPRMERMGIRDGSGDMLSASQGANRLRSIVRGLSDFDFSFYRTATSGEVSQAATRLGLTEFSFTSRPTNPHPVVPGEIMDELMRKARVGKMTGKAEPVFGETMSVADEGLISESIGLAEEGYGQIGFKGTTNSGTEVAYPKPKFERSREGNIRQQAKASSLKVFVPTGDVDVSEEEYVVRTMIEIYDG